MTLCPVTGKLIAKGADGESDNSELERLLTDDEKQQQQDGNVSSSEQQQQLEGETTVQDTEIQQLIENEDGSPVMVTGDDGTIYQVAGKNAEGQTLLIAQGAEGEQACVFVAASEEGIADWLVARELWEMVRAAALERQVQLVRELRPARTWRVGRRVKRCWRTRTRKTDKSQLNWYKPTNHPLTEPAASCCSCRTAI